MARVPPDVMTGGLEACQALMLILVLILFSYSYPLPLPSSMWSYPGLGEVGPAVALGVSLDFVVWLQEFACFVTGKWRLKVVCDLKRYDYVNVFRNPPPLRKLV